MDRRIDLDRARREAKRLLQAARAGDEAALGRIRAAGVDPAGGRVPEGAGVTAAGGRGPEGAGVTGAGGRGPAAAGVTGAGSRGPDGVAVKLADAQLAVARELGEASWPRLVRRGEAESIARDERAGRLVKEAVDGRLDHAGALLAVDPDLGRERLDTALVLGEAERVRAALARDPGLATREMGWRSWLPLLYVAHSAFLGGERTDGLLACARALLDAGADPNSSWEHPEFGSLSALCGAAGVNHEPRMTALLLDAGADPDDGESVYHATEGADHACLQLLLDAGAKVEGTNALAHAIDREDPEMVRLLLEHDPGHEVERILLWAIYRDRSPEIVRMLVDHGADLEAWDERNERTPYGLAWRMGRPDLCELLAERGARRRVGPIDELLGLCFAGERERALALAREHPERVEQIRTVFYEALHQAAAEGRAMTIEILLELGVPIDLPGERDGTPLHHAAWMGWADAVDALLAHGADAQREAGTSGTPLAWTAHGSFHAPREAVQTGDEHLRIAEALLSAGARIQRGMLDVASVEVAELLSERAESDGAGWPEPYPDAEASWAAQVEWLRRLAASPSAQVWKVGERRAGGDGVELAPANELRAGGDGVELAPANELRAGGDGVESAPAGELRAVGGGFAVITGVDSNSENGVVCSRLGDDADDVIADVVRRFDAAGAPAQWLLEEVTEPADLRERLMRAGCRPERTSVVMGAAVSELSLPDEAPPGVRIAPAQLDPWLQVAGATGLEVARQVDGVRRWVAWRADAPVGLVSGYEVGDVAFLQHLAVVEDERRKGIGSALLAAAVRGLACARVVLDPTPDTIALYRKLGFELRRDLRDRVFYLPLRE